MLSKCFVISKHNAKIVARSITTQDETSRLLGSTEHSYEKEARGMAPNFYNGTTADYQSVAFARCTMGLHLSGITPR